MSKYTELKSAVSGCTVFVDLSKVLYFIISKDTPTCDLVFSDYDSIVIDEESTKKALPILLEQGPTEEDKYYSKRPYTPDWYGSSKR